MTFLRQRDPRIILAVCGLSSIGDFVAFVVLTVRVFEVSSGSAIAVGGLLLVMVVPGVVLTPLVGWLVDHFETRRVLVATSVGQAVVVAALALTTSLAPTLALAFVLGAGVAIARPAVFALLPRIAGDDNVTELNAWYQMVYFGGASVGPAVGGYLTGLVGPSWSLLIDAATFLVLAAGAAALRTTRPPVRHDGDGHAPGWRQGLSVVVGDRVVLIVMVVTGLAILMVGAANVGEVFLAKGVLDAGDFGYGLLNASWTLGMVLLLLTVGRRLRPDQLVPGLLIGLTVASAMTLAVGLAPTIAVAVVLYLIGGGGNGIGNVALRSAIQHRVPDHQLGRAFAVFGGLASAAEISSAALGGVLVEAAGVRGSFVVLGAAGIAAGVAGVVGYLRLPPAVRAMPERVPMDAAGDGVAVDGSVPVPADGLAGVVTSAGAALAGPAPVPEVTSNGSGTHPHERQASEGSRPAAH
jgi:MFS family permease